MRTAQPRTPAARRRLAAGAAAALALLAPLGAAPVDAAAPPALAGTTTFTVSRSANAVVRLPRAATLLLDGGTGSSPSVDVGGRGRVYGALLTRLQRPEYGSSATLILLGTGLCAERACVTRHATEYVTSSQDFPREQLANGLERLTLPAGTYAVRGIADGSPVRVTLRLAGLSGRTTVPVTRPHRVTLETYSSSDGPAGVSPLRNAGGTHRTESDLGFAFHVVLRRHEPHVRSLSGYCYYRNAAPRGGKYVPGCPGAQYGMIYNVGYPALKYEAAAYGSAFLLLPGEWTQGFYLTGVSGPSVLTAVALWTDLG